MFVAWSRSQGPRILIWYVRITVRGLDRAPKCPVMEGWCAYEFLSRKSKTTVGLDIGSSYVKVSRSTTRRASRSSRTTGRETPARAIVEGEIMTKPGHRGYRTACPRRRRQKGSRHRRVWQSRHRQEDRDDKMNPMTRRKRSLGSKQHVPFDIDDVCLDSKCCARMSGEPDEILLVAARGHGRNPREPGEGRGFTLRSSTSIRSRFRTRTR